MAASSVTGTGPGSSDGGFKGPGNGRNVFVPLNSPHVVAAGSFALVGGTYTYNFPLEVDVNPAGLSPLSLPPAGYCILVTSKTANAVYVASTTVDANGNLAGFTITGTGSGGVNYVIIQAGQVNLSND